MAIHFWRTKTGIGANGAGTEQAPYTPVQLAAAIRTGVVVPGDVTMLMGECGPVNLADAADFPAHTRAASDPLDIGAGSAKNAPLDNAANSGSWGRNIVFGTTCEGDGGAGSSSAANGISFLARGGSKSQPNVDMRGSARGGGGGATVLAERQMAAIIIQGYRFPEISGFYIRPGDWEFNAPGRVTGTTAAAVSNSTRYTETSDENVGLLVRGAWGSVIQDCYAYGGDFGTYGIKVDFRIGATSTIDAGRSLIVRRCEAERFGVDQIRVQVGETLNYSAGPVYWLPDGSYILIEDCNGHDAYFYASGYDNVALRFANLIGPVDAVARNGARFIIRNCRAWGDCQDAMGMLIGNGLMENCEAFDTCPTWAAGASFNYPADVAGVWTLTAGTVQGNGIKTGLGNGYEGTAGADIWTPGTGGGTYGIDQLRAAVVGCRVINTKGLGMSSNGGGGLIYHANEVSTAHAVACTMVGRSAVGQHRLTNNYFNGTTGLRVEAYNAVEAWNNVCKGSAFSAVLTGTGASLTGGRNLLDGSVSGSPTWAGNFTGTAGYVVGVGPTAGGNCDGYGSPAALAAVRHYAARRDMTGRLWRAGRMPIGPRRL